VEARRKKIRSGNSKRDYQGDGEKENMGRVNERSNSGVNIIKIHNVHCGNVIMKPPACYN
jgi:hypothetical protein